MWGVLNVSDSKDDGSFVNVMSMTVQIVSAYVMKNQVGIEGLMTLIENTQSTLSSIRQGVTPSAKATQEPVVPIEQSIKDTYLVCLEDGRKLKMLRRHLHAAYGMSPDDYRAKWRLPPNYPMVAPAYSRKRAEFARNSGLGKTKTD